MEPEPRDRYFSLPNSDAQKQMARKSMAIFQKNDTSKGKEEMILNPEDKAK